MPSIYLFGGSFNPPHRGHRQVLEHLVQLPDAKAVWVIPVFSHPFSKDLEPFEHRKKMCEILIQELPHCRVSLIEKIMGCSPSYTIDTLRALRQECPEEKFTLVLGSDCRNELPQWKEGNEIPKLASLYFIPRAGYEVSPFLDIASQTLRERLTNGEDIHDFVLPEIEKYIKTYSLYQSNS